MKIKNALIIYKKSAFKFYFLEHKSRHCGSLREDMKKAHDAHTRTLALVKQSLRDEKIKFISCLRGKITNYRLYDLVITVGGDGTLLEAARCIKNQTILGVNSDPERSIGRLCTANRWNFKKILKSFLEGKAKIKSFNRICLTHRRLKKKINALNDILFCHENPAAMSRYRLIINGIEEDQRGSGLWVAAAAGSSGAIRGAGGKVLPRESKTVQYMPRELFRGRNTKYRLTGGVISLRKSLRVHSLMRSGLIYIDGAHVSIPFRFGDVVELSNSNEPLRFVDGRG